MAILLGCDSCSLEFPTKTVLQDVTLGVSAGDRIGIVGRNGDGKSTLLRVLAQVTDPDEGRVTHRRGLAVGTLWQTDSLDDDDSVGQAVTGGAPEHEWASDARTRQIIAALISDIGWDEKVGSLSGGQRRRVDLARLLIGDWDVLMLDEPTNHLDIRAINWLAQHLLNRWPSGEGALLCVTHDRWFLDEVCTGMWEVHDGQVDPFEGGYSAYVLQRVERDRQAAASEQRRQNLARKELNWLAHGAKARTSKPKFRIDAAMELISGEPPVRNELELKRLAVSRLGKQVVDVLDCTAGYPGRTVLRDVTWLIGAGDRFAVLGVNGAGKSTLLKLVQGQLAPISGRVKIGKTVRFGVLSQRLDELAPRQDQTIKRVLADYKRSYVIDGKETTPEKLLERLGFTTRQLLSRVKDLSGGQQRRLSLLLVLLEEPNVLILDEPGNDLDTDMLAVVEDLLDGWPGTLILVSHDRFLVERVTDSQYALIDGTLRHCPGGVDEYLRLLDASHRAQDPNAVVARAVGAPAGTPSPSAPTADSGLGNAERRRLTKEAASLERKLETRRKKLDELKSDQQAADPTDFKKLEDFQAKIDALSDEIDQMETDWLEISDRLEG